MKSRQNVSVSLLPFILSVAIFISDQASKAWVVKNIPLGTLYKSYLDDFLWIVHVRNTGAAFSLGAGRNDLFRVLFFIVVPLIMMGFIAYFVSGRKSPLDGCQRWFAAGILGGGMGTIADRILRFDEGVVDFISVKFYGILGMDRWPTFNLSDSCVVVSVILLAVSMVVSDSRKAETQELPEDSEKASET